MHFALSHVTDVSSSSDPDHLPSTMSRVGYISIVCRYVLGYVGIHCIMYWVKQDMQILQDLVNFLHEVSNACSVSHACHVDSCSPRSSFFYIYMSTCSPRSSFLYILVYLQSSKQFFIYLSTCSPRSSFLYIYLSTCSLEVVSNVLVYLQSSKQFPMYLSPLAKVVTPRPLLKNILIILCKEFWTFYPRQFSILYINTVQILYLGLFL